jgi:DNA-binding response OmpR family regulator
MNNILLLEPDRVTAKSIKSILEDKNITVSVAKDSQSAIYLADKKRPDLVIVELAVADQNGVAFLHEFRSYMDWKNIPIIVHSYLPSVLSSPENIWKSLGIKKVLYKPQTNLKTLRINTLDLLEL